MRSRFISLTIMFFIVATSVLTLAASPTCPIDVAMAKPSNALNPISRVALSSKPLTPTVYLPLVTALRTSFVYLPLVANQRSPLFVGMTARWDSVGYGRGSDVWDAGFHLIRTLDTWTDMDTIRINNYDWYSPNPFGWSDWSWYSYYSVSTLKFIANSYPHNPAWKWEAYFNYVVLPYDLLPSNGATVAIDGQAFLVSGPYPGYTAFGQPMQYWQFTNKDEFLFWDDGGDWKAYMHPGDVTLLYDAGSTRLLIHCNELRRWYHDGSLTSRTTQWIDNLTSTNAWPTAQSTPQDVDFHDPTSSNTETETIELQWGQGRIERPIAP
jgi:hypothetical protein